MLLALREWLDVVADPVSYAAMLHRLKHEEERVGLWELFYGAIQRKPETEHKTFFLLFLDLIFYFLDCGVYLCSKIFKDCIFCIACC